MDDPPIGSVYWACVNPSRGVDLRSHANRMVSEKVIEDILQIKLRKFGDGVSVVSVYGIKDGRCRLKGVSCNLIEHSEHVLRKHVGNLFGGLILNDDIDLVRERRH